MVNTALIGEYIQFLRKQKHLSQKDLAEALGISFQAVSKWETGENLPDANILLELADILDTTTDKILTAGALIVRKNKKISVSDIQEGFIAFSDMRTFFGAESPFYRGAVEGINQKLKIDIEEYLKSEKGREALLAEAIVHYLVNGYHIDTEEIERAFSSPEIRAKIKKYQSNSSLFGHKAKQYASYRPSFPSELIDLIFAENQKPVIADIASGTGRLAALCIDRAKTLYAIEPNENMRKLAEEQLSSHQNYISLAAFAENTTLSDNSIDIITVAGAYHYFDSTDTKKEFYRILKPNGKVFLFWNRYTGNAYDKEKEILDEKYRKKKKRPYSGITPKERAEHLFGKNNFKEITVQTKIHQTFDEFFGGWSSASYTPDAGSDDYPNFKKEALALFTKYANEQGLMEMNITSYCFFGTLLQ